MLFNSQHFLIFFPIVVLVYFRIPHRHRWIFLLAASYYFYMCWKAEYVLLIIFSTVVDYFAGIKIGTSETKSQKTFFLIISLTANLGLLFFFKYFNFFSDSLRALLNHFNLFYNLPYFHLLLPVGISFYTFQTLSYTIDVYRGQREPEYHFGYFAVYVSFFPQLVAGPIERSTRLLPQFFQKTEFDLERMWDGVGLMFWGYFKKVVIADRLAIYVNEVYNNPGQYHGLPLILATYFFAFQIYCDFSGYSDIAIGSARVLGYELMQNFDRPYASKSVAEFWRRWHISLSTWFKDYLYIPLGGNRVSTARWYYNILIVFVLSGLWHGANWTFIVWGTLHGAYIVISSITKKVRSRVARFLTLTNHPKIHDALKVFITFHLVLFAWIFFRSNSISDLFIILKNMLLIENFNFLIDLPSFKFNILDYTLAFTTIIFMELVQLYQSKHPIRPIILHKPTWMQWSLYSTAILTIILFGAFHSSEFIYFQF